MFMKSVDIQAIIAVTWGIVAISLTIILWSSLGGRGWLWLGIHHTFCIIGCTTEYFRYQGRQERKNIA